MLFSLYMINIVSIQKIIQQKMIKLFKNILLLVKNIYTTKNTDTPKLLSIHIARHCAKHEFFTSSEN